MSGTPKAWRSGNDKVSAGTNDSKRLAAALGAALDTCPPRAAAKHWDAVRYDGVGFASNLTTPPVADPWRPGGPACRLRAAGADLGRVQILGIEPMDGSPPRARLLPDDCGLLREMLKATSARLLIGDPLFASLSRDSSQLNVAAIRRAVLRRPPRQPR